MPVRYRIDAQRSTIHTECMGNVTLADVLAHFDELESDPFCPPTLDVVLNLTTEISVPEPEQLRGVADRIRRVQKTSFRICAIATRSEVLFGMARMFEVFTEPYFEAIQVFRDLAEAEAWLQAEQRNRENA